MAKSLFVCDAESKDSDEKQAVAFTAKYLRVFLNRKHQQRDAENRCTASFYDVRNLKWIP